MFCVIQFSDEANNSVGVVRNTWLTPMKKEVFWPPYKDAKQFRRALQETEDADAERWQLYGVSRVFYQTGK